MTEEIVESSKCKVADKCEAGEKCEVDDRCETGEKCEVGDKCEVDDKCKVADECETPDKCEVDDKCKVADKCETPDKCDAADKCETDNCKIASDNSKQADEILFEYFKINRYPKKTEKIKLAAKANVTLQYVMNYFYNARGRERKAEKECPDNARATMHMEYQCPRYIRFPINWFRGISQPVIFRRPKGNSSSLYLRSPIILPSLLTSYNNVFRQQCDRNGDVYKQKSSQLDQNDFYY